jgi:hypothetical protein
MADVFLNFLLAMILGNNFLEVSDKEIVNDDVTILILNLSLARDSITKVRAQ